MAVPERTAQNGTYFVTAICAQRRRILQTDANAQLLFDVLQHYRTEYRLHSFVIMPEHLHLLITPLTTLERAMQCIKGGFSRRYHLAGGASKDLWQRGFTDHRIRNREDFDARKVYLEQNPVARGLALRPQDYRWSSAFRKANPGG